MTQFIINMIYQPSADILKDLLFEILTQKTIKIKQVVFDDYVTKISYLDNIHFPKNLLWH